jgi:hypothetical protein
MVISFSKGTRRNHQDARAETEPLRVAIIRRVGSFSRLFALRIRTIALLVLTP